MLIVKCIHLVQIKQIELEYKIQIKQIELEQKNTD